MKFEFVFAIILIASAAVPMPESGDDKLTTSVIVAKATSVLLALVFLTHVIPILSSLRPLLTLAAFGTLIASVVLWTNVRGQVSSEQQAAFYAPVAGSSLVLLYLLYKTYRRTYVRAPFGVLREIYSGDNVVDISTREIGRMIDFVKDYNNPDLKYRDDYSVSDFRNIYKLNQYAIDDDYEPTNVVDEFEPYVAER